ncbi:TetR family transcriptional regulator [Burkholderia sp. WAC0059]|uniref:TetR/AcrR family transcriptional regulator n=1 Tax=Burkholderia sp. WAC0059 TaxID=2066022 RepID=UPI000C7EA5E6|nr:TetR/AcrR family transcriptional regulator [Burkholderia sp. WAC0059]PLZ02573.1 TetR family transcriptional regulator [Burkholderia sp. WAC0059]
MKNSPMPARSRGRPRGFDRDAALADAMRTFWKYGYEGASIADLTGAMGITPQSLYAAFRSKADLYREALDRYRTSVGGAIFESFQAEPEAVAAFGNLLRESARAFCRRGRPRGCMVSTGVLTCAAEHAEIAAHVAGLRGATIAAFEARVRRAIGAGELRSDTDAAALARYVGAVVQGMSVQARDGAKEAELAAVAEMAAATVAGYGVVRRVAV